MVNLEETHQVYDCLHRHKTLLCDETEAQSCENEFSHIT